MNNWYMKIKTGKLYRIRTPTTAIDGGCPKSSLSEAEEGPPGFVGDIFLVLEIAQDADSLRWVYVKVLLLRGDGEIHWFVIEYADQLERARWTRSPAGR